MTALKERTAGRERVEICPLCHSASNLLLYDNFDRLYGGHEVFGLTKCQGCHLVRLDPRPSPSAIKSFYPDADYYSYTVADGSIKGVTNRSILGRFRDKMRSLVLDSLGYSMGELGLFERHIAQPIIARLFFSRATYGWGAKFPRFVPDGRVLDVGSGNARFLSFLKHHGWHVIGIDFSEAASDFAREEFGIEVHVGTFEDAPLDAESFDYINLSHVVEHTFDPIRTIDLVARYLKPGGVAYIEVPNFDSFSRRRSEKYWYPWETPRHLFMFSPSNLVRLVESSGLQVEKVRTENGNFWAWDKTYRLEEQQGKRLETRPLSRFRDQPEFLLLRALSGLHRLFQPMSGDFICCWVKKAS